MNQSSMENLNGLLQVVSQKLGVPPEQLRQELEAGKFDNAIKNMNPSEAARFQQVVKNPGMLDKIMSTPQAKALYQKLTGGR